MPADEGVEYYLNRRRASVAMSLTAEDPGVRKIHREFAQRYADLAGIPGAGAESRPAGQGPRGS